jgi:hypothetical protein
MTRMATNCFAALHHIDTADQHHVWEDPNLYGGPLTVDALNDARDCWLDHIDSDDGGVEPGTYWYEIWVEDDGAYLTSDEVTVGDE